MAMDTKMKRIGDDEDGVDTDGEVANIVIAN